MSQSPHCLTPVQVDAEEIGKPTNQSSKVQQTHYDIIHQLEETNSFSNNDYFSYNTCSKCLLSFSEEEHYSIKKVKGFHI